MVKHYINQLKSLLKIILTMLILANACAIMALASIGMLVAKDDHFIVFGGLALSLFIFWLTSIMKTQNGKSITDNLWDIKE